MNLEAMELTEIYVRYTDGNRLCQRLDGRVRTVDAMVFVPVEDFHTGERFEARMDLLQLCADMEIIALAARPGGVGGRNGS